MADGDGAIVRALLKSLYEAQTSHNKPEIQTGAAALEPKTGLKELSDAQRKAA
jgi:hypothetical protein